MSNNTKERIFNNITETVGRTPMVRLLRLEKEINTKCEIIAKLEFFNIHLHEYQKSRPIYRVP